MNDQQIAMFHKNFTLLIAHIQNMEDLLSSVLNRKIKRRQIVIEGLSERDKIVSQFIDDCCDKGADFFIDNDTLTRTFAKWSVFTSNHVKAPWTSFRRLGYQPYHFGTHRGYKGLRLKANSAVH